MAGDSYRIAPVTTSVNAKLLTRQLGCNDRSDYTSAKGQSLGSEFYVLTLLVSVNGHAGE
jgi:hypothetical protein